MTASIDNQRPGVYSRYDTTSGYAVARSAKAAALVGPAGGDLAQGLLEWTTYGQALEALGTGEDNARLLACARILFESGVARVLAAPVNKGQTWEEALALAEAEEGIGAVIGDAQETEALAKLKESVERSAETLRERVAFAGVDGPGQARAAAKALNSERVALCCPAVRPRGRREEGAVFAACALAGRVLAANDPGYNWNGEALATVEGPARLGEGEVQDLLRDGVTVLEPVGEGVEVIRALTTRTASGGAEDPSLRSLNTILIIDDVVGAIRTALRRRLRGLRMSAGSLESIRSQVAVELAAKQDEGLIESFAQPAAYAHPGRPEVCVVELSFGVAHVVHQIHVTAHVQV